MLYLRQYLFLSHKNHWLLNFCHRNERVWIYIILCVVKCELLLWQDLLFQHQRKYGAIRLPGRSNRVFSLGSVRGFSERSPVERCSQFSRIMVRSNRYTCSRIDIHILIVGSNNRNFTVHVIFFLSLEQYADGNPRVIFVNWIISMFTEITFGQ